MDANASSVPFITCSQTEPPAHRQSRLGRAASAAPPVFFLLSVRLMTASLLTLVPLLPARAPVSTGVSFQTLSTLIVPNSTAPLVVSPLPSFLHFKQLN